MISKLGMSKISHFKLVSVVGETGLKLGLLETPETGFFMSSPYDLSLISVHCLHEETMGP